MVLSHGTDKSSNQLCHRRQEEPEQRPGEEDSKRARNGELVGPLAPPHGLK